MQLKRRLYRFQLKRGFSISDHINNYTEFLTDLANVNAVIDYEDKELKLLSFLPDDSYETFVLTLIYRKTSLSYSEVTIALVNLELRQKDKESLNITLVEVLSVRGKSPK